jgi:hypothetical protein
MKKVVSSFLAVSAVFATPAALSMRAFAQAAPAGQVTLDPAEYADYDAAIKQSTPATQAPALDAYLTKYPKSPVKATVLQQLMLDYYQTDHAKAITTADKVLQLSPNNLQALAIEVAFRSEAAQATGLDAATKQSDLDAAADYAKKGIAVSTKTDDITDAQFQTLKKTLTPTFYSTIGLDSLNKKDYPAAIDAYKTELSGMDVADTQKPGTGLQDTYYLGQAYYQSSPPDLVNCTFYTTRAASFAPDAYKTQLQPLATYCYKKYHGGTDGYDDVVTAAKASLNPPSGFTIKAAPTPEDQVTALLASTKEEDLPKLALSDKEFVIENGKSEDADKVFNTIKGKEVEIPNATVVTATADALTVSVSDDAVQSKTADFTFTLKTPLKKTPVAGDKIALVGTYASYTQKPLMITMSDGAEAAKAPVKAAKASKAPVHHTAHH